MAARLACARWEIRCKDYVRFVHAEIEAARDFQVVAVGCAALELFEEKWERVSDAYTRLEVDCPEPENPDNQATEDVALCAQRRALWEAATAIYDRGYKVIADRIIAAQVVPGPTGALRAEIIERKRHRVFREARKRVERLGTSIATEVPSTSLVAAKCFDAERKEIQALVDQLEEVTGAVMEADPGTYLQEAHLTNKTARSPATSTRQVRTSCSSPGLARRSPMTRHARHHPQPTQPWATRSSRARAVVDCAWGG